MLAYLPEFPYINGLAARLDLVVHAQRRIFRMKNRWVLSLLFFSVGSFAATSQRTVLLEDYSSSTCPYCADLDKAALYPFLQNSSYQGKYLMVSYRVNWPGKGDLYYISETSPKIAYYPIVQDTGVPQIFIDGKISYAGSANSIGSAITAAAAKAPKAAISASHMITGTSAASGKVKVSVTITPVQTVSGAILYIALCEKSTTKNASTNGETVFYHVVMKMLPNGSGRSLTLTANTAATVTDSANLTDTHIESMSNLEVIAWVQVNSSKEVLQAVQSVEGNVTAVEPVDITLDNNVLVRQDLEGKNLVLYNADNAVIQIQDISGKLIEQMRNDAGVFRHSIEHLSRGCYLLRVIRHNVSYAKIILVTH